MARKKAGLVERLDEAAKPLHDVIVVKLALNVFTFLGARLMLSPGVCMAWLAVGLAIEGWLWFATGPKRSPKTHATRLNFLAAYGANVAWWLLLGMLFWRTHEPLALATAAALFATVAAVSVLLFYNVPPVFFFAGSLPAIAAFATLNQASGGRLAELAPVWIVLGLCALFCVGRAIETPSIQDTERQLNTALASYETLAENVSDIIARTSLDGRFEYISPSVERVLGYTPDDLIGRSRWTITHPDTDKEAMKAAYDRLCAAPTGFEAMTIRVRHRDGRWIWLQSSGRLIFENGAPVAAIDISRDVTAQVEADLALRDAKAQAEAATRAKGEFLANISHEIRTPMNGVLGALQLLEREGISTEGRELLRQASDCGKMLSQLLNDILDFSKIEAGQLDLSPEPVDLSETLGSVVALLNGQARVKAICLETKLEGNDFWVMADPVRLRQIMFNLVGNAVKFTTEGRVEARLRVAPLPGGGRYVAFEVEDTGIGIAPEVQERLFERFHQGEGDVARRFGGTGLGLSITRALVDLMGGILKVESAPGAGSTFSFTFQAQPAITPQIEPRAQTGLLEGVRILLVEDNPTNRLMAGTLLGRLGALVTQAEDGIAGVDRARNEDFDLILMDIQMPHMGGIEATEAIRGLNGPRSKTPIIALTANVMAHQRATYLESGMDGVVAKPISAADLVTEIARILTHEPSETRSLAGNPT